MKIRHSKVFPGRVEQVREARVWLNAVLCAHGTDRIPDGQVAAAVLLLSEAATNAIRHTATGRGGKFEVHACLLPGTLTVECVDGGRTATRPAREQVAPLSERGRGLALVDAYADTWGPLTDGRTGLAYTLTWRRAPSARLRPVP
ncbi:ATP-binding protein [Nocardiopsis trehalosi]|uniref:ATP-binding protein n=1 Tax=Nocardiopsis trehalosi TaxID=109329 RepID=UPI00082A41E6|nr:ATP-binding protein [Nocardiopsis trehalosi]